MLGFDGVEGGVTFPPLTLRGPGPGGGGGGF